jgi:hypothetical protein
MTQFHNLDEIIGQLKRERDAIAMVLESMERLREIRATNPEGPPKRGRPPGSKNFPKPPIA